MAGELCTIEVNPRMALVEGNPFSAVTVHRFSAGWMAYAEMEMQNRILQ